MSGLSNISCDDHNRELDIPNPVKPKLTICTIIDRSVSAIDVRRNFVALVPEAGRVLYLCNYVQWFPKMKLNGFSSSVFFICKKK